MERERSHHRRRSIRSAAPGQQKTKKLGEKGESKKKANVGVGAMRHGRHVAVKRKLDSTWGAGQEKGEARGSRGRYKKKNWCLKGKRRSTPMVKEGAMQKIRYDSTLMGGRSPNQKRNGKPC